MRLVGQSSCLLLLYFVSGVALAISFSIFFRRGSPMIAQAPSEEVARYLPFWDALRGAARFNKIVASLAPK
jgi:hypothetical protein